MRQLGFEMIIEGGPVKRARISTTSSHQIAGLGDISDNQRISNENLARKALNHDWTGI